MFSILQTVFIFLHFCFLVFSYDLYGPYPRIVSNNGNLVIYAADHKNISLKTTSRGYINLNDENLILLLKKVNNASITMDRFGTNVIEPLSSSVKSMTDLIYGSDGLLRRLSNLENNVTTISPSQPFPMRNRNLLQLNRRVRILETKMIRVLNLLTTNDCESNPCKNGGECIDMYNGYFCRCLDSWTGTSCETDVNECTRFHGTDLGCQNGATCINKQGSYECICATGWYGLHCNRRSKDCNSGSTQELCGHGTCVTQNTPTGYTCICDQGWTTNGISPACTVDVNECDTSKTPVCSTNPPVPCINVPGTFYCGSCPSGYSGNGFYCNDIDECLTNNGGCSLLPRVQCINTMGSRMCGLCPSGYIGDGITCSFQGVCHVNNGGCHPQARCISNPHIGNNFVQCICPAGYVGNGMGPNGCIQDTMGPITTACSSFPCVHGTCNSNSNNTFVCVCQIGYTGKLCDTKLNPCDSNPCKNGATCINKGANYTCSCTTEYTGFNCENERQACGGKLVEQQGYLQIPPTNNTHYSLGLSCSWVIQTVPEKVLNVTFTKFHLESRNNNNNCVYDWLQIHDGTNSASHMIGRFCGTALPNGGQIITTHNSLYIWFRSDRTDSYPGFALKWTTISPICGGNIMVSTHGTIKSPGSPGNYPPNRDCEWVLRAPYGKRIQFHFFTLNIGNNPNCSFDYLSIYSGFAEKESLLAQFCNSSNPEPLIVPGSVAFVKFHSDASGSYPGFQISYAVVEGIPGCGGLFTADRGEISSPVLDEQYHSNSDCDYKIKLRGNTRIKITFLSFALEESNDCRFDYISIHEGGGPDSPLVGRYCGSVIPPSYTSLGNVLFIRFKTDRYINDDGFRIKYETVCENTYVAPSGTFQSPGYPIASTSIKNCLFVIKQKPGTAIKLTITDMSIGKENCNLDYLEVRDGDNENSTLIGKYCGWTPPDEIISTHNYLSIKMITLSGRVNIGFLANYSTIDLSCGGILKDNMGIIKNPESANMYPLDSRCTWIISAPPGYIIQLTWVLFNIEWSRLCQADSLTIYENNTISGYNALIGKYCGKTLPPMLFSTTNLVTLIFTSDYSQSSEGFIVNYNLRDESTACGGHYFIPAGVIKSPNYPLKYPANKDCVWILTVPHGQQIMLHVEDFNLEPYINCVSDYLEIRNGAYVNSPLIGIYCGKEIPKTIPSHTNNLYIKFHSDSTNSRTGFKISWDGTTTGCGGNIVSPTGQIVSPNYPQPYGQNAMCLWKISTSAGSVIRIIFLDLGLEPQIFCRLDYVEIYDGSDVSSKSLGRYCLDTHPITLSTSGNRALIKFRSDVSYEDRGFLLKYITVCNNTLQGYAGVIESLNFPNTYLKNQNCSWTIKVPQGNKINITFSHFDLERAIKLPNEKECKFDYVEINEGYQYSLEETLLNKTCGTDLPPHIQSNSNEVTVHFVSDSIVHNSGFRLEWEVVGCSAFLTKPVGKISTPGYPNWYPTSTTCEWLIQVDYDSAVELTVGKFDFETSAYCYYDSLKIFNGPDENSPVISIICHSDEKGITVTSTSRTMFVKFSSDSLYAGKGFQATYKTVPSKCGGKFTAPSGSVFSRDFPQNYKTNDDCEWLIEIHPNHIIELEFHEFDLVSVRNCTSDYLEIYDGNSTSSPLIKKFCGGQQPNGTIKSSTNTLYLKLTTGSRITAKGFLANYTTGCGSRLVTSTNGIIEISDWKQGECEWTIIADQLDKHVSLTITHLDLVLNTDNPALHIYDGTDSDAPLIGGYGGTKAPSMIVSKGAALHIKLNYGYAASVRAIYSVIDTECGATMTSLSGYFGSVGYPNNYPMNTECQWTLNVAPGNKVLLSFLEFDLIASDNCNADYVEVRESNAAGKLLGVYCGNTIPSNISQSNSLWVQFKSTDVGTAKGFLAEYTLSHGNELFGTSGQIASPLYPLAFDGYEVITWRITVEFKSVILITFKDFFIDWFSETDCQYWSGFQVYDGYDDTTPVLTTLCSLDTSEVRTSSNIAYIVLNKEILSYKIKFFLEWKQVHPITSDILRNITVEKCGSNDVIDISSLPSYDIKSPGYPHGYAPNLNCEWIFSVEPQKHISIAFTGMDLEGMYPCMLDNVKIYTGDKGKPKWRLLNTLCLSNSTAMGEIHTSNLMKVVFETDAYVNKTGFSAIITPECGGSLTDPNGIIEIDNFKRRGYFGRTSCEWNITVKAGRTIQIKFLKFNITNNEENSCNNNYIMLKNGRYPDSPFLGAGKYCGTTIPEVNETTGNSLYIKYQVFTKNQGFKLSYTEKSLSCGQNIKLTHSFNATNISSPNYPNIPPAHSECIWVISAPPGETIQVDFIERFDIESTFNCEEAGVELRDGGTRRSKLLDTYCTQIPSTQKTSDNFLYIRFYTDVPDPRNGFKAIVSIATCGGTIRAKYGKLTSPFYPNSYSFPVNTVCTWNIIGSVDHFLNISFTDFRFPYRNNCTLTNHVLITETLLSGNETTLATLCGIKNSNVQTSSNTVKIQMKIVVPNKPLKGFNLNFNSSQETCGGTIEADSGVITSPGYPISGRYRACQWIIIVPEGRRVTANIIDFDLDQFKQGLSFHHSKEYRSFIVNGNNDGNVVKSSSNIMMLFYWVAGSINHRGFKVEFKSDEATVCTGDFSQDAGTITVPNTNLSSYFCQWTRRPKENENVFTNRTLVLTIDASELSKQYRRFCKYAMTAISVTAETDSELNIQLCNYYSEPKIIRNPYPTTKLTVIQGVFDKTMNYTIKYKVHPCGGILTLSSGVITSPNYPNQFPDSIDCAWVIKTDGQPVKLNFTTLDLDKSCTKDYIEIYNGPSPSSPKIGRFCGTTLPNFIQSQANSLWIEYHASVGGEGKVFSLTYETIDNGCGGIFHDNYRIISTPNYPKSYPNNVECIWEVQSEYGYHIGLHFVDRFHIENSTNCTNDYIEVLDYENENWVSMGRYCGRVEPSVFNSTSNRLRIIFRSNEKLQASGFKASWTFNCGGTFIAKETPKYLVSPGYPIGYSSNLDCKYIITTPGKYVNIVFEDFGLEDGKHFSSSCAFDNVTISRPRYLRVGSFYDRIINTRNTEVYCGSKIPPPLRWQDQVRIWFRTDRWVNRKGFKLRYYIDTCGGPISNETEISSPVDLSGKNTYYTSINCVWNITAPKNKIVIVQFTFFEFEYNQQCSYDSVTLYNGKSLKRLAILCGNITTNLPVIRSTDNNMLVVMKTDSFNNFRGFKANVLFMYNEKVGCGGVLNLTNDESQQSFKSPDIDGSGQYVSNLDCRWLVVAPLEETIELNFNSFHFAPCNTSIEDQKCTCDYLQLRDGAGPLSELISQPCGHDKPTKVVSSGNRLWIRMVTDGVQTSSGFKATVKKVPSICGKSLLQATDKKQLLVSPGFPQNYPNNIRCTWILQTNSSFSTLEIHFDHFELQDSETEDKCTTDKLEIFDKSSLHYLSEGLGENLIFSGPKSSSIMNNPLPMTSFLLCGSGQPPVFYSERNQIIISFKTDTTITKKGFQLDYRIAGCNRNYTTSQGRIMNERISTDCIITISAPINYTISLYFQSFLINDYQNCATSGMLIHDGNSSNAPQLAKYCGFLIPNPVFSKSNELWIKIKTNGKGYKMYDIIYTTTDQGRGCGGDIYNYMGTLTSPMYPNNYRNVSVCRWNLSVPRRLKISLKFSVFDLGPIHTCQTDYVELIDINSITKQETVRSRYCSRDKPAVFLASNNLMAIRYVVSTNNAGTGWSAQFTGKGYS